MEVVFLGCTKFSEQLLKVLRNHGNVKLKAIFSIPKEFTISYSEIKVVNSNYSDLSKYANDWGIPYYEVDSVPGKKITDYKNVLIDLNPDVLLVLGWYYMIPSEIRNIADYGAWGIHASLLPKYAGGAPLVWAIINGEKETGVTLFRLSDGVDNGDIIDQKSFPIEFEDSIKEVYEKATEASKKILMKIFSNVDRITFTPQNKSQIEVYPQREPKDGEINLDWPAESIYDFIRAQSSPYPGAFIRTTDGKKLIIEKARIEE